MPSAHFPLVPCFLPLPAQLTRADSMGLHASRFPFSPMKTHQFASSSTASFIYSCHKKSICWETDVFQAPCLSRIGDTKCKRQVFWTEGAFLHGVLLSVMGEGDEETVLSQPYYLLPRRRSHIRDPWEVPWNGTMLPAMGWANPSNCGARHKKVHPPRAMNHVCDASALKVLFCAPIILIILTYILIGL